MKLRHSIYALAICSLAACGDKTPEIKPVTKPVMVASDVPAPIIREYASDEVMTYSAWKSLGDNAFISETSTGIEFIDDNVDAYDSYRRFLSSGEPVSAISVNLDATVLAGEMAMVRFTLTTPVRTRFEVGVYPSGDVTLFNEAALAESLACEPLTKALGTASISCTSDIDFDGVMIDVYPSFGDLEKGYKPEETGSVAINDLSVEFR